jgi:integrase
MTSELNNSIANHNPSNDIESVGTFDSVVSFVKKTVGDKSGRVYEQTYRSWSAWCEENQIDIMNIHAGNVYDFLDNGNTTIATRRRQLSAMRKFAQMLVILDGQEAQKLYESLKVIKAPKPSQETTATNERTQTALSPSQADKLLRVWSDDKPISIRNRAIIRILIFTGMRRSELAVIKWDNIDFENQVIYIPHGKGDKPRPVSIMDTTDNTIDAIKALQALIPSNRYAFVGVTKSGKIKADKPITDKTVYRVVQQTAKLADLPQIAPHDLRRTHITEDLATGNTLANVQAQAGHAQASTTLGYAQNVDAIERRKNSKFRFGA